MDTLEQAAGSLRAAIASERFREAGEISVKYARLVVERWRKLPPGDPEIARVWSEAQELLGWARRLTLAQRAQLAGRLEALQPLVSYLRDQRRTTHALEVRG